LPRLASSRLATRPLGGGRTARTYHPVSVKSKLTGNYCRTVPVSETKVNIFCDVGEPAAVSGCHFAAGCRSRLATRG
jgi:hypothetical protein